MGTNTELRMSLAEINPDMILYDGYDAAIVGVGERCGSNPVAIYSYNKLVEIIVDDEKNSIEDAIEHIHYNILGGYLGENTPIILSNVDDI